MWTESVNWLGRNAEWVFSGIGVAVLAAAAQWLSSRRGGRELPVQMVREAAGEVAKEASNGGPIQSGLTPSRIMREFKAAPLLQRQQVASHYRGLTLRVGGRLHNAWGNEEQTTLQLSGLPTVFLDVVPSEWPGLPLLKKGAPITALGEVKEVSEFGVTLSPRDMDY